MARPMAKPLPPLSAEEQGNLRERGDLDYISRVVTHYIAPFSPHSVRSQLGLELREVNGRLTGNVQEALALARAQLAAAPAINYPKRQAIKPKAAKVPALATRRRQKQPAVSGVPPAPA